LRHSIEKHGLPIDRSSVVVVQPDRLIEFGPGLHQLDGNHRTFPEWAAWANGVAVRELVPGPGLFASRRQHSPLPAVAQHCGSSGEALVRGLAAAYEIQVDLVKGISLSDAAFGETIAAVELRELAMNMPAVGRALVTHRKYRQSIEQAGLLAARLGEDRQSDGPVLPSTPFEEVRDFFYLRHNYIAELDEAAEGIAQAMQFTIGQMDSAS
jgi:hypothetical protein